LVKVVRRQGRAIVQYDPREGWTANPRVLGNAQDRVYRRIRSEVQPDGMVLAVLLHQKRRQRRKRPQTSPPPKVDLVIHRVRCVSRSQRLFEVRVRCQGKVEWIEVQVEAVGLTAGSLEAISRVVEDHQSLSIAIPSGGPMATLYLPDGADAASPSDCSYRLSRDRLLAGHVWQRRGEWLIGTADGAAGA